MNERRDSSSFRGVRARASMSSVVRSIVRHGSRTSTSADGVHFSLSNTSRPVRSRPKLRPGVHSSNARRTVGRWRSPAGYIPDGIQTVYESRTRLCASGPTQDNVVIDVPPVCGRWCGASVVAAVQSRTVRVSVCDDSVSGTRRTRLETRTKESSMCASH